MLQKLQAASFWAKIGYLSLAITVLLGLGNVGEKAWSQIKKVDARYVKQTEFKELCADFAAFQRDYEYNRILQLEQQLYEMEVRWGPDKSRWSESQRAIYFQRLAELNKLKDKLGLK